MPLEPTFDNIDDLDPANPFADDPVSEGDDHLRGIKKALQANVTGDAAETRLLVAGLVKLLAEAAGITVTGFLIQLDTETDNPGDVRLLNTQGGVILSIRSSTNQGDFRIFEADDVGAFVNDWMHFVKAGGIKGFFNGTESIETIDPTRNSTGQVFDVNGTARPIGYNTLPPTTVPTSTVAINDHNGHTIDVTGNGISYTLADLYAGWTVNVLCSNAGGAGIVVPGGISLNLYEGGQLRTFGGPSTLAMNRGSALTITQRAANSFNAWGGNVA